MRRFERPLGLWLEIPGLLRLLATRISRSALRHLPAQGHVDSKVSGTPVIEPVTHLSNPAQLSPRFTSLPCPELPLPPISFGDAAAPLLSGAPHSRGRGLVTNRE